MSDQEINPDSPEDVLEHLEDVSGRSIWRSQDMQDLLAPLADHPDCEWERRDEARNVIDAHSWDAEEGIQKGALVTVPDGVYAISFDEAMVPVCRAFDVKSGDSNLLGTGARADQEFEQSLRNLKEVL